MLAFGLITLGLLLYYSKSKYFLFNYPESLKINTGPINALLILIGTGLYIYEWGWAAGLLMTLAALMLSLSLLQFSVVIAKRNS